MEIQSIPRGAREYETDWLENPVVVFALTVSLLVIPNEGAQLILSDRHHGGCKMTWLWRATYVIDERVCRGDPGHVTHGSMYSLSKPVLPIQSVLGATEVRKTTSKHEAKAIQRASGKTHTNCTGRQSTGRQKIGEIVMSQQKIFYKIQHKICSSEGITSLTKWFRNFGVGPEMSLKMSLSTSPMIQRISGKIKHVQ